MKRRKWTGRDKLQIVLEGIKGQVPLGELCARHQLSQSQFYQWRDQLLRQGERIFDHGGPDQTEQRLRQENRRLKALIGELTVELKKSEAEPW
jgi:transposase-like protein